MKSVMVKMSKVFHPFVESDVTVQDYKPELHRGIALPSKEGIAGSDWVRLLIDREICSPATRVIFPAAPYDHHCLKLWIPCNNDLYDTLEDSARIKYLLDGLAFNRYFSPEVYLGITPVLGLEKKKSIYRAPIIVYPQMDQLRYRNYAMVMKRLPENWRLDHQLHRLQLSGGVSFLAGSIASMHKRLDNGDAVHAPGYIEDKLMLNVQQFEQALEMLDQDNFHIEPFTGIGKFMYRAYETLAHLFELRAEEGFIKICHGDLKATNLWLKPESTSPYFFRQSSLQLLALDCVDFNPKFSNIDTLSDVAMLAVDLEMRLSNHLWTNAAKWHRRTFAHSFLMAYLENMDEQNPWVVRPLLEYYMIEKAMVCAYISIIYDKLPTLGKKYLRVALNHMLELKTWFAYAPFATRKKDSYVATDEVIHSR